MEDDAETDIMDATYRALCAAGYADLTMQDIADEAERSKAALHYHYDTKRDLLCAFLDHLYADFERRIDALDGDDRGERLVALLDAAITPPDDDHASAAFQTAVLEIQAQAPYDDGFRERLARFDDLLFERFRDLVAAGVEDGTFAAETDPEAVADFLVTAVNGAHTRRVAAGRSVCDTHDRVVEYLESHLTADAELPGCPAKTDAADGGSTAPDADGDGGAVAE